MSEKAVVRPFCIAVVSFFWVSGCSSSAPDFDKYIGCYALDDWRAEVGSTYLKLNNPGLTLPAYMGRDKVGDYVLVDRPVWYVVDATGKYRLTSYRGSGTFFRLRNSPKPTLTLPVVDADEIQLTKTDCR